MADVRLTVGVSMAVLAWVTGFTASCVAFGPVLGTVLGVWVVPLLLLPPLVLWDGRAVGECPAPRETARHHERDPALAAG